MIHSAFNVIATLVLLPFGDVLVEKWLVQPFVIRKKKRAISEEDQEFMILESRFFLILELPLSRAKQQQKRWLSSPGQLWLSFGLLDNFQEENAFRVEKIEAKVDRYEDELGTYLIKLNQKDLSLEDSHSLSIMLHCIGDFGSGSQTMP
ncbi:MAG: hypothetical protein V8Q57_04080 [Blautia sp.]